MSVKETLIQRGLEKSQARYDLHKALVLLENIKPTNAPPGVAPEQFQQILHNAKKALNSL